MKTDAPIAKSEERAVLIGLCLAMLLSALDQTIVAPALPTIGVELGDYANAPWVVTSYLVAATIVTPLYGKLADIHGARAMLLVAIAIFILGSFACALAPGMIALCLARVLQAAGGGGILSLAQIAIADLVSPLKRGRYQTWFASVFVTSSVAGPALGGFFAEHLHWSLIFWINLPLGLLALAIVRRTLLRLPVRRHPHRIDYPGAVLLAAASGLLALGLSQQRAGAVETLALIAASGLFWWLFVWRQKRAAEPFFPLSVLQNAIARDAALSGAFGFGAFIAAGAVTPIYFQGGLSLSIEDSGLALIPMMIGTVVGATISGRLMPHLKRYKAPAVVGLAIGFAAALSAALRLRELNLLQLNTLLTVTSVGVGAMLPVSTVSVQNAVDTKTLGAATAILQFSRQIGGALIAALLGALVMGEGAGSRDQVVASFQLVFGTFAAFLGLSLLFLVRMEEKPLRGE
ncbi:MAG TPA: MDR family MFS transporter [Methylocystis sp.]|nr:MDR family MFS transporter [Methylocystis sp.]